MEPMERVADAIRGELERLQAEIERGLWPDYVDTIEVGSS